MSLVSPQVYAPGPMAGISVHAPDLVTTRTEEENEDTGDSETDDEDAGLSETIRNDLSEALREKTDFKGTYSFHKAYLDAPNPGLEVQDAGIIGMPLSVREAEVLKTRCTLAPFGKGERTLVDKNVRDTWEMDASKVVFSNPQWDDFIARTAKEACQTLGVNYDASRPRCELYKLLLYETGSHFLPHVDTEKVNGMFATIVIVLPSLFTGGEAHLSHAGMSRTCDSSSTSRLGTSVLAWYTDVTHEIKPITSGYRLALSYNLIHTTQSLRPALSTNVDLVEQLRRVMLTWTKNENENSPDKLIYLLEHTYSQANLNASALKGVDAHKVAMLNNLAHELGFQLGLASVECTLTGAAEDTGYHDDFYYGRRRGGWGRCAYDYDDYGDDDHGSFADPDEVHKEMSITGFVDLDGKTIATKLEYNEKRETIPANLTDTIQSGSCDDEEYEGYQGNYAGDLTRFYRRTVLVIWPKWNSYSILYSGKIGFQRAHCAVAAMTSSRPAQDETELVNFILRNANMGPLDVAKAVCHVACQWNDPALWTRAVMACCTTQGVTLLAREKILAAIEIFGLNSIQTPLEHMLKHDEHNATRIEFLDHLDQWSAALSDASQGRQVKAWAAAQLPECLKCLKKPSKDEEKLLIDVAKAQGGIDYLKDSMLHQLVSLADSAWLANFASAVHGETEFIASETKTHVVSSLLGAAVSRACFFQPTKESPRPTYAYYYNQTPKPVTPDYLAVAKSYAAIAHRLGCAHMIGSIIDKLTDSKGLSANESRECSQKVMLPLAAHFAASSRIDPTVPLPSKFNHLREMAVKLYLEWLEAHPNDLTKEQVNSLLEASAAAGKPDFLITSVWPQLQRMNISGVSLQTLISQLHEKRALFIFSADHNGPTIQSIVHTLAKRTAARVSIATAAAVIAALDWCISVGAPELTDDIVGRITAPSQADAQYINVVLVPLLPELHKWSARNNRDMNIAIRKILVAWTDRVLGPLPAANANLASMLNTLGKWTCSCEHCQATRTFLTKKEERTTHLYRIGAPKRKHLESFLAVHARNLATWEMIRSTPQGLTVNKSEPLCKLITWRNNQAKGANLVKALGSDPATIQRILGPDYEKIFAALNGVSPGASAARTVAAQARAPAQTPTTAATSTAGPSTAPAVRPLPAAASAEASAGPARKRRKILDYKADDVIDLT